MTIDVVGDKSMDPADRRIRVTCDTPGCKEALDVTAGPYPSLRAIGDVFRASGWDVNGTSCSKHKQWMTVTD